MKLVMAIQQVGGGKAAAGVVSSMLGLSHNALQHEFTKLEEIVGEVEILLT